MPPAPPPSLEDVPASSKAGTYFDLIAHGHRDLVQAVAFNEYGDRCATGSVDGKIRVFNRQKDGTWRMCDNWGAHSGEVLELQWLPPTVHPNLLCSLGIEGRFKLWAEDNNAAPGRRFSARGKPTYEHRSSKYPYRSFSVKHDGDTKSTYFAFISADGKLSAYESAEPETLTDLTLMDDFQVLPKPSRGEETCFKVRFDPNPDPCYVALRAGVSGDALSLVVSGKDSVKVFRTRDTTVHHLGSTSRGREFYLAVEITGHKSLVRDVAWAPGNIRGYDIIATACQDGHVRVFRVDTPLPKDDGRSWAVADIKGKERGDDEATTVKSGHSRGQFQAPLSGIRAEIDKSGTHGERLSSGQPGQIPHTFKEIAKLDTHRSPVWRVGFDDDGQMLGSVGDEGKLMCYRQTLDGSWAKSSELGMMKSRLVAP